MKYWYSVVSCAVTVTKADKVMPLGWYEITEEMYKEMI
jgi:hypothetical protein